MNEQLKKFLLRLAYFLEKEDYEITSSSEGAFYTRKKGEEQSEFVCPDFKSETIYNFIPR